MRDVYGLAPSFGFTLYVSDSSEDSDDCFSTLTTIEAASTVLSQLEALLGIGRSKEPTTMSIVRTRTWLPRHVHGRTVESDEGGVWTILVKTVRSAAVVAGRKHVCTVRLDGEN